MQIKTLSLGAASLIFATSAAHAVQLQATPRTMNSVVARARSGDEIKLQPGSYGQISILNRNFVKPLKIDASAAQFSAVLLRRVNGVEWRGGRLIGPRQQQLAFFVYLSTNVFVGGVVMSGPRVGLTISNSQDVQAVGNSFDGIRSDGINIAMSQRIKIIGNACLNFHPIRPIYGSDGKLIIDGDHPDCIQAWSRRGYQPTAHIVIENNAALGEMQGIWLGDPGQGGYEDVVIRNNDLTIRYWHGIAVTEGRGTVITNNRVQTMTGARALHWPFQPITSWIKTVGGKNQTVCGNIVPAMPGGEGTQRCSMTAVR